jgi:SAM-dependent methyltransferase
MNIRKQVKYNCVECGAALEAKDYISRQESDCICGNCGKIYKSILQIPSFLSKEDEQSSLFQKYFANYSQIASDDISEDIMPVSYKNIQADKLVRYCGSKIKQNVLDIGSGKGFFLKRIPHNNKVGVDISLEYLKILQSQGIECALANAENLPFKENFDVIVLSDILEHVFNPEKALQQVYKALNPKGIAVIRVPYKEDISIYLPENGCKYEFVHLRSFDEHSLTKMVQSSGLKLIKIHYDGFLWSRIRRDASHPLIKWVIKKIDEYVNVELYTKGRSMVEIDDQFNRLPNFLSRIFFAPIECVAIAKKDV